MPVQILNNYAWKNQSSSRIYNYKIKYSSAVSKNNGGMSFIIVMIPCKFLVHTFQNVYLKCVKIRERSVAFWTGSLHNLIGLLRWHLETPSDRTIIRRFIVIHTVVLYWGSSATIDSTLRVIRIRKIICRVRISSL